MSKKINLNEINIRTKLKPGDIGYIIYRHGYLYSKEYDYGIKFESYVAEGFAEFYKNYNPQLDRVWICEHKERIIGFLLLMHREERTAQLRYFLIEPEYRGIGLGRKLMNLYMEFFDECGYTKSFLWTTHELSAAAYLYKKAGFKLTETKNSLSFGKPITEQKYDLIV